MLGFDIKKETNEIQKRIGVCPQDLVMYERLTARENIHLIAQMHGMLKMDYREKTDELLGKMNLLDRADSIVKNFSGGMKRRLNVLMAVVHEPELLFFDEPTAGLDPGERVRFHNLLSEIGENIVVILSTHIVDDVSDLCSNMAIIHKGKIVLKNNTLNSMAALVGKIWEKEIPKQDLAQYEQKYHIISSHLFAGKTFIRIYSESNPENDFSYTSTLLEDVYFFHVGQQEAIS